MLTSLPPPPCSWTTSGSGVVPVPAGTWTAYSRVWPPTVRVWLTVPAFGAVPADGAVAVGGWPVGPQAAVATATVASAVTIIRRDLSPSRIRPPPPHGDRSASVGSTFAEVAQESA